MEQFAVVLLSILVASILNILLKSLELPTAIGYIFTGILIAAGLGENSESKALLDHISELGIIFLMFTIGLEFSFAELKAMRKQVFIYGTLQVALSALLFALIAFYLFGFSQKSATVIGLALSLSSTAIVLKMLNENGDIHSGYGRKVLGVLLFQDIAVIPILIVIQIFTKDVELSGLLATTARNLTLFLALFILARFAINYYLKFAVRSQNQEIFLLAILFIVLTSAETAHLFGFSYSLGAFFAGMLLAESHYKYQIEADLAPFRDLLLGLFFFVVGYGVDLSIIYHNIFTIAALVLSVMALKAVVLFLVLIFGQKRTAFKSALALSQIGEFSLVIFVISQDQKLIDATTSNILAAAVIISMILTPFIINNLTRLADKLFTEPHKEFVIQSTGLKNHIIVCGYGPLGHGITKELKEQGLDYILIEHDLKLYEEALENGEPVFFGNAAQRLVLESINIKEAVGVVITLHNLEKIRLITQAVIDMAPKAHIVARVRDNKEREALGDCKIDTVFTTVDVLTKVMSKEILHAPLKK